ncbi:MAG: hydrogenase nickel incorporation protein HypB [Candidatus Eisenbacteria bacterium]|nr:hydrogenase nickel incorporation protein HypB [Candidatus Eisenbacteria bacterium]
MNVQQRVLAANDEAAAELRRGFRADRMLVVNLISSPGSGKTSLLEATVRALTGRVRMAALDGDIATERDADRLRAAGIPAHQILTGGACHLDARQVRTALEQAGMGKPDILFIENVGNLICPTSYDLGEDFKVAVLSVTEGEDKPFKYPAIFSRSEVTVITKSDLLPHVPFKLDEARAQVAALNPTGRLFVTSATSGEGIREWCDLLMERLEGKRRA